MTNRRDGWLAAATVALVLPLLGLAGPSGAEPPAMCDGLPATIVGTDGDDVLTGTNAWDVISAGDGADVVRGGGGGDVICGGAGDDLVDGGDGEDALLGEDGDDELLGGDDGDELAGGPGDDLLRGGADAFGASDLATFDDATAGVVVDLAQRTSTGETEGSDTLVGIEGARGSAHPDQLLGSRVNDLLVANGPGDVLRGEDGDDTLRAAAGEVYGGNGDDLAELSGTARGFLGKGDDRLAASTGATEVSLGPGADHASMPAGSHTVTGGRGADTFRLWWEDFLDEEPALEDPILLGGKGADRLEWDMPWSVVIEVDEGELSSSYGTARFRGVLEFRGGEGSDRMYGGPGRQVLLGDRGDDLVKGYGGRDVLRGGPGDDQAYGGPGRDRCRAEYEHGCERN